MLRRAINTAQVTLDEMGLGWIPMRKHWRLNERHYGALQGLNKTETAEKHGADQVHIWRRSYDTPPPGGESLKDTGARVWPYYMTRILPDVMSGKRVLVSAHGNSLRSLAMVLDRLSPDEVVKLEIGTGVKC